MDHEVIGITLYKPKKKKFRIKKFIELVLITWLVFSLKDLFGMVFFRLQSVFGIGNDRSLKKIAASLKIPVTETNNLNSKEFIDRLKGLNIDVIFNQTSQILKKQFLEVPRYCVMNRHMAYLPFYKGAFPVFWQFLHKEKEYGVTIHKIDEGIDTGEILSQEKILIKNGENINSLYKRLFEISPELTIKALDVVKNQESPIENLPGKGSYFSLPQWPDLLKVLFRF